MLAYKGCRNGTGSTLAEALKPEPCFVKSTSKKFDKKWRTGNGLIQLRLNGKVPLSRIKELAIPSAAKDPSLARFPFSFLAGGIKRSKETRVVRFEIVGSPTPETFLPVPGVQETYFLRSIERKLVR